MNTTQKTKQELFYSVSLAWKQLDELKSFTTNSDIISMLTSRFENKILELAQVLWSRSDDRMTIIELESDRVDIQWMFGFSTRAFDASQVQEIEAYCKKVGDMALKYKVEVKIPNETKKKGIPEVDLKSLAQEVMSDYPLFSKLLTYIDSTPRVKASRENGQYSMQGDGLTKVLGSGFHKSELVSLSEELRVNNWDMKWYVEWGDRGWVGYIMWPMLWNAPKIVLESSKGRDWDSLSNFRGFERE